jgi:succinyldiaminopimelate transaminase
MTPTSKMDSLPPFPWDSLAPYKERASSHAGGLVDLSVGTPVDPTPQVVQAALRAAADAHGYPQTWGTAALRESVATWFARRRAVPNVNPDGVLPTVGSKELVAWLPTLLGAGPGDVVAFPALAYPTYDVGARLAGASTRLIQSLGDLDQMAPAGMPKLLWVNSPGNPTGQVLSIADLAEVVGWARRHGVVVASDECYAELDWRVEVTDSGSQLPTPGSVPSILDPSVCEGSHDGLLAVYSLSKQSNMAGYRAAFVAGDPALVGQLLEIRKHAGMMVPWPVQQAMIAALADDGHVGRQRALYGSRRGQLRAALNSAGYRIEHSEAGLYLWATMGAGTQAEGDWPLLSAMADLGILVAPGSFYGAAGRSHMRLALSATDERIDAAVRRLEACRQGA